MFSGVAFGLSGFGASGLPFRFASGLPKRMPCRKPSCAAGFGDGAQHERRSPLGRRQIRGFRGSGFRKEVRETYACHVGERGEPSIIDFPGLDPPVDRGDRNPQHFGDRGFTRPASGNRFADACRKFLVCKHGFIVAGALHA